MMIIFRYFIVIMALGNAVSYAMTDQERFLTANNYYEQGEYSKAIEMYNKIDPKGRSTWYNLGNAYYHTGSFAKALVCWERARKGASRSELVAIEKNIQYAQENLSTVKIPDHTVFQSLYRFARTIPSYYYFIMTALFILFVSMLGSAIAKASLRMSYKIIICILFFVVTSFVIVTVSYYVYGQKKAYVVQDQALLYVGPGKQYHTLQRCNLGSKVNVLAMHNEWYKIECDQISGWVEQQSVDVI